VRDVWVLPFAFPCLILASEVTCRAPQRKRLTRSQPIEFKRRRPCSRGNSAWREGAF
jgi:hypothetical protein